MRFLTTKQISGEIERVIREANNFIIIISPYVNVSNMYIERLLEAEKNNVKTHFVFGKEQIPKIEETKFSQFTKMKMHYLDNLHAKCYLNEEIAIITSMNLYEYSEQNNREMGLLIEKKDNEKIYSEISREANSVIQNAEPYFVKSLKKELNVKYANINNKKAYCIRCGKEIDLNTEKPMCFNCYNTWADFFNYDYPERHCHVCGNDAETTMAKPLCYNCFRIRN
jgi:phosphatidylserine/phosphatidylglycerophosphate/cardiolipin synthase-like enzyme